MRVEIPELVQDPNAGEYRNPLYIDLESDGTLVINGVGEGTWAYFYPEQTRALFEGLKAHYEEEAQA